MTGSNGLNSLGTGVTDAAGDQQVSFN